jgi:hypothetical protein
MLKTKFEEIVNINEIGTTQNSISMNELLTKATGENLIPAKNDKELVLFFRN